MRKHAAKVLVLAALILTTLGISCSNTIRAKEAEGTRIIEKIEKFKVEKGRLPGSLMEIGIVESEEGPVYYKQLSDGHYQLWYGSALGESVIYDSDRKTWK